MRGPSNALGRIADSLGYGFANVIKWTGQAGALLGTIVGCLVGLALVAPFVIVSFVLLIVPVCIYGLKQHPRSRAVR